MSNAHISIFRNMHKFTSFVCQRVGDLFVKFVTALSKNIHLFLHHCFQHFVELPVVVVPNPKVHHLLATQKGYACVVCTIVCAYIFSSNGLDVASSVRETQEGED